MPLVKSFCCLFSLRFGSCVAASYVGIAAILFFIKDLTWIHVLTTGTVPPGLNSFVFSVVDPYGTKNISRIHSYPNLATANITEKTLDLTRRYIASYVLHAAWSLGGLVTSVVLMAAAINQHAVLVLPWISWSAVNIVIVGVNFIVDLVMWIHFKIHSSLSWFALFSYISLPFMLYQILIVASYFTEIEWTAVEPMSCSFACDGFSVWYKDEPLTTIGGESEDGDEFSSPAHLLAGDSKDYGKSSVVSCGAASGIIVDDRRVRRSDYNEERTPIRLQSNRLKLQKPKIKITQPSTDRDSIG